MGFFGMGAPEIIVIMIVALVIFGPGKLPEIGAQVGRTVRDFRKATRDLTSEFEDSMNDVQSTMGEMKQTMADVQRETKDLAESIPVTIEGRDTGTATTKSTASAAASRIGASPSLKTSTPSKDDASVAPIAVTPAEAAAMASKDDPFADLAELDEEPVASGKTSSGA